MFQKNKARKIKIKKIKTDSKIKKPPLIVDAFNFRNTGFKAEFKYSCKNFNWKITIKNLILIFLGALLTSISFYYFINRGCLYTNGLSAFAQLITKAVFREAAKLDPIYGQKMRALFFYPVFFAINIPIIIWGVLKVGFRFALYTTIFMTLQIGITTFFSEVPAVKDLHIFNDTFTQEASDKLLKAFIFAILGGLIYGAGLGILFKTGGSSGGMDFISTYISMKRKYSIANIIKNTNIIIVIFALLLDGTLLDHKSFFEIYFGTPYFLATIVYIYIGAFVMNRVYPKYMLMTVFIISNELEEIRTNIYRNNYIRGGNVWNVKGLYSGNEYKMMMTTMSLLEYNFFKLKIAQIDEKVFMVAVSTKYMLGGNTSKNPPDSPINIDILHQVLNEKQNSEQNKG